MNIGVNYVIQTNTNSYRVFGTSVTLNVASSLHVVNFHSTQTCLYSIVSAHNHFLTSSTFPGAGYNLIKHRTATMHRGPMYHCFKYELIITHITDNIISIMTISNSI